MSRSVAAFFLFLLLGAGHMRAQLPNPDPFSPPSRQLVMCQPMPAASDTSVVGFRFIERDSLITRDAILAYKTTGQPLNGAIYIEATGRDDSTNASFARVDYFLGHGMRFENRGDGIDSLLPPQMDENGQPLPRGARPLLAADMERARTLARGIGSIGVRRRSMRTSGDMTPPWRSNITRRAIWLRIRELTLCIAVLGCASPSPSRTSDSVPPPGSQFAGRKLALVFAGRVTTPDNRGVDNALIDISFSIDADEPAPCDRASIPLTGRTDKEGRFALRHDGPSRPRLPLCALVEVQVGEGQSVRSAQRVLHGLLDNPVGEHGEVDTVHLDVVLPQSRTLTPTGTVSPAASDTPASARRSSCRPADSHGPALVAELRNLVSATDSGVIAARDSLYHIPVVSPHRITLVADAATCSKAAAALTNLESSRPVAGTARATSVSAAATTSRTVVVAKVGTHWAVEDPNAAPHGRFLTVVLFDSTWKQVGGFTGP